MKGNEGHLLSAQCCYPGRTGKGGFTQLFTPFSSLRPVTTDFESFGFPLCVKESMLLLLSLPGLLSGLHIMFRVRAEISREVIQTSAPKGEQTCTAWEKMGQVLGKFSATMVWKFTPKEVQDPVKVTEYLQGECCGNSREEQLIAVC